MNNKEAKYKVGDTFRDKYEDRIKIVMVAPTPDSRGGYVYFVKVTEIDGHFFYMSMTEHHIRDDCKRTEEDTDFEVGYGYHGLDVNKLPVGSKFYVKNGHWYGEIIEVLGKKFIRFRYSNRTTLIEGVDKKLNIIYYGDSWDAIV